MNESPDQRAFYDSIHKQKLERFYSSPELLRGTTLPMEYFKPNRIVFDIIRRECESLQGIAGKRILDLACGEGHWACWLASLGAAVTANDISEINVRITELRARVNRLVITGIVGDCTNIAGAEKSFDLILGAAVIHHLTISEEERLYQEVLRLLKPGGCAVFMESIQNSATLEFVRTLIPIRDAVDPRPSRLSKQWKAFVENDPHPKRPNTTAHYQEALSKSGFSTFKLEELGVFSRLDRITRRGYPHFQEWIHDVDYKVGPYIPFARRFCRNIVITAWK